MHIYRWLDSDIARQGGDSKQTQSLPVLETKSKWTKKIHPGLLHHLWPSRACVELT